MLAANARQQPNPPGSGVGYLIGLLLSDLGVPLLFALSIRWTRSLTRTGKASRLAQS